MPEHIRSIRDYLKENKEAYILPPVTLNVRKMPQVHVHRSNAAVRLGYLVIPDEAVFFVTDGQHRIAALAGYNAGRGPGVAGLVAEDPEFGGEGLAVLIVYEPALIRIHQDFADAAQTKQIPASLLAAYNMREPINRVLHRIVEESDFLKGRVDETSKTLGKLSQSVFLLNQVRGLLKELLVGDYGITDDALGRAAVQRLGRADQQDDFVAMAGQILDVLSSEMEPWTAIKALPREGAIANQIPDFRKDYLNLTATGLVIIGHVAYEINKLLQSESDRLAAYRKLATAIDWKRNASIWKGSVVTEDGRLVTNRQPVRDAGKTVAKIVLGDSAA